jgi:hypothetical protein
MGGSAKTQSANTLHLITSRNPSLGFAALVLPLLYLLPPCSSFANVCIGINTYDYTWVDSYWDDAYPWGYYR